jgi:ATP-dependent RNA helicase HelY
VPFDQVAGLATSRSFVLRSAFRPTYNMAANLVRSYSAEEAHHLLNLSFAQYQADREVVRVEARLERRQAVLADLRDAAVSPYGDIEDYRALLAAERSAARAERPGAEAGAAARIDAALVRLRPGDVVLLDKGRHAGPVAVLTTAQRKGSGPRVRGITRSRVQLPLSAQDFDEPPRVVGRIELPTPFTPNRQSFQREVARALERAKLTPRGRAGDDGAGERFGPAGNGLAAHPVTDDPDLADRLRAAAQADRVGREVDDLRTKVKGRSESLGRRFDRVLRILEAWEALDGWQLTEWGERLARLFHECDLLVVESLRQGLLDDLDPASMAALVSVFVYEHRSSEPPPAPWFPSAKVRKRWLAVEALAKELNEVEEEAGLTMTRRPDPTFLAVAYAWAAGEGFAEVVEDEELSGGDFVRNVKQLIDLLRQLADVAPLADTRQAAASAHERLFRGVVAASAAVDVDVDDEQ